jgi:hypothetical protein
MSFTEKKLLAAFTQLVESDQATLLAFAEFLAERDTEPASVSIFEPHPIPRPVQESVVAAIKRLSATYPMLDKPTLLNETSVLMTRHVMQGRDANGVIDELETLFRRYYEEWVNDRHKVI